MPFISPDQLSSDLRRLFSLDLPVGLRCRAILNGDAAGRVWVDDPDDPRCAIVQELADGTLYLGGSLTAAVLSEVIDELRREREVVVGLWPGDPHLSLLPPNPYYDGAAIDFTDRSAADDLSRFLSLPPGPAFTAGHGRAGTVEDPPPGPAFTAGHGRAGTVEDPPPGCRMQAVDGALFARMAGYEWTVALLGGADRALERGLGCCLMQGDLILSEAFAGPQADGVIEIGVHTHEPYRGHGYATLTCAHLIRACEAKGYQTFWNASTQNMASLKLARRLGYRTEREFRVLAWPKSGQQAAG